VIAANGSTSYPKFAEGMNVVEIFGDNLTDFQRIKAVIDSINANAMPLAA